MLLFVFLLTSTAFSQTDCDITKHYDEFIKIEKYEYEDGVSFSANTLRKLDKTSNQN